MVRHCPLLAIGLAGLVLTSGCNFGPQKTSLRGEVTFDGQPVEEGSIVFFPLDGTDGREAVSQISKGRYEVPAERGVRVDGDYRVRIVALSTTPKSVGGHPVRENFIPAIYNSESTLTLRVRDLADKNKVDFVLAGNGGGSHP